jgi:hypothetical protein
MAKYRDVHHSDGGVASGPIIMRTYTRRKRGATEHREPRAAVWVAPIQDLPALAWRFWRRDEKVAHDSVIQQRSAK